MDTMNPKDQFFLLKNPLGTHFGTPNPAQLHPASKKCAPKNAWRQIFCDGNGPGTHSQVSQKGWAGTNFTTPDVGPAAWLEAAGWQKKRIPDHTCHEIALCFGVWRYGVGHFFVFDLRALTGITHTTYYTPQTHHAHWTQAPHTDDTHSHIHTHTHTPLTS